MTDPSRPHVASSPIAQWTRSSSTPSSNNNNGSQQKPHFVDVNGAETPSAAGQPTFGLPRTIHYSEAPQGRESIAFRPSSTVAPGYSFQSPMKRGPSNPPAASTSSNPSGTVKGASAFGVPLHSLPRPQSSSITPVPSFYTAETPTNDHNGRATRQQPPAVGSSSAMRSEREQQPSRSSNDQGEFLQPPSSAQLSVPPPLLRANLPLPSSGGAPQPSLQQVSARPIDEVSFIGDVLFMWMGADRTKYFHYNVSTNRYEFFTNDGSVRQRKTFEELMSCGCLARDIEHVLGRRQASEMSFLQQSLRNALRRQMSQYHAFLASLRETLDSLSTADLVVAQKKIAPKLSTMWMILCQTESAKGGELASAMQELAQQGSARLSDLVEEIHLETVLPLLRMAVEWTVRGDAADPFHEFFVKVNQGVDLGSDAFWTSRYSLEAAMLPTAVSREVAERIILVGKNITLITRCCRAKNWRMEASVLLRSQSTTFATLPSLVDDALSFTNRSVMQLVHEKLKLKSILKIVQNFLLIGNGDFYEGLIRRLDGMLSKMSTQVQASVVADQVQVALLEASNYYKHLDSELILNLQAELTKVDKLKGWECFSLTLPVASPLNNVFDTVARKTYRKLFRMMFSVKRAEVALKNSWRQYVVLDRQMVRRLKQSDPEAPIWRKVAGDAHHLGLQLMHFVTNLWSYFVSEVSTTAWEKLQRAITACQSFDEVREAHIAYLQQLTMLSLLHADCTTIRDSILRILGLTYAACSAQQMLTNVFEKGIGNIVNVAAEYQRVVDEFEQEIGALLHTLEEQHLQFDFLNFLLLRLNFNQYYRDSTQQGLNTDF